MSLFPTLKLLANSPAVMRVEDTFIPPSPHQAFFLLVWHFNLQELGVAWKLVRFPVLCLFQISYKKAN